MNKKAGAFNSIVLVIIALAVVGGVGYLTNWYGLVTPEPEETPTTVTASQAGEQGTLKYSAEAISEDTPVQFAITGYCWDVANPSELLESRNGKTLSATAGTTFATAFRGNTYECTAFDATHTCDHDSGKMVQEGLNLRSECKNVSSGAHISFSFFESGTKETGVASLTLGSQASKSYGKWAMEINTSKLYFPIGAVCLGTNVTDTHVDSVSINGWSSAEEPATLSSRADDYCFTPPAGTSMLAPFGYTEFNNAIKFDADSTGTGTNHELWTVVLIPKCEYVAQDGSIKTGYYHDDPDETLCGSTTTVHNTTIKLV